MKVKKISIKSIADNTMTVLKVLVPAGWYQMAKCEFDSILNANDEFFQFGICETSRATGDAIVSSTGGMLFNIIDIVTISTSGGIRIQNYVKEKMYNYEVTEPEEWWICIKQRSGGVNTATIYLYYTDEKLPEVVS